MMLCVLSALSASNTAVINMTTTPTYNGCIQRSATNIVNDYKQVGGIKLKPQ